MGWILAWAQPAEPEVVQPDDALVQANEDLTRIRAIDDVDLGAGLVGGAGALSQPAGVRWFTSRDSTSGATIQ